MRGELVKEKKEFKTTKYIDNRTGKSIYITHIYDFERANKIINAIKQKYQITYFQVINYPEKKYYKITYSKIKGPFRCNYNFNFNSISYIQASKNKYFFFD